MHAAKGLITLCVEHSTCLIQEKFYKSKISARFPNFDVGNAWQNECATTQERVFFLVKNSSWTFLLGTT